MSPRESLYRIRVTYRYIYIYTHTNTHFWLDLGGEKGEALLLVKTE